MATASTSTRNDLPPFGRGFCLVAFALAVVVFLGAHYFFRHDEFAATAIKDTGWWVAAVAATLCCARVAARIADRERRTWWILCAACGVWAFAQTVWSYYDLVVGRLPVFPHWMQIFFSAYDWLFVVALLFLPTPDSAPRFSAKHAANIALIACAVTASLLVAILEPAMERPLASTVVVLLHCLGLTSMFVTSLYLLWSYPWSALYWPLGLLVLGSGTHLVIYVAFAHQMMTQTYRATAWFNASWLIVFGLYCCAAYERLWSLRARSEPSEQVLQRRERWLEAMTPAFLIIYMLWMVWAYRAWLTSRVAASVAVVSAAFAVVLGLREMWMQRQEQLLVTALNASNSAALASNRELLESEARYRTLSAELERRVDDRTLELQQAYRELENFSYAVAHDLKAPLRAVDGFGSLLSSEFGEQLGERGQDYLARMRRSALKMADLIDDLLAYSRVERRELQIGSVELAPLIENLIAEQREYLDRYRATIQFRPVPLVARADAEGVELALRNLIQNAIKFSQHTSAPRVDIELSRSGSGALILIRDNGVGFDMAHHDKIFELFQRLHRADEFPGTGIGLAIVRKAIERMGGRVWAESKPGHGATFFVRLVESDRRS